MSLAADHPSAGLYFDCRHRYAGQKREAFEFDAAFETSRGVTGLFGPSGAGKSTTLAIIAGLLRPRSGVIRLGGRTLLDTTAGVCLPPEKRNIGMVFQDGMLFPHLPIEANLRYGLKRRPAQQIDFGRVVEILELGDLLRRQPITLSGGQRRRVALGRALLRGPELLLMDEPLTSLDEGLKGRIVLYLERALAEWQIPTLLVTHDIAEMQRLAERVVMLSGGRVVESGEPHATLARLRERNSALSGTSGPMPAPAPENL